MKGKELAFVGVSALMACVLFAWSNDAIPSFTSPPAIDSWQDGDVLIVEPADGRDVPITNQASRDSLPLAPGTLVRFVQPMPGDGKRLALCRMMDERGFTGVIDPAHLKPR